MYYKNTAAKFRVYAYTPADGLPKTGDAANLTAYVSKDFGAVTVLADTSATEEDATNAPGYYLFDAAQGETNADVLMVSGKSSTSGVKILGAPAVILTMPTTGVLSPATLGRTLVVDASGLADANAVKVGPTGTGTAQTARDIGASVLLSTGTGTGQLDFTSGVVKSNLAQILGTALTETAGLLAGGFKKFFNISSPAATMDHGVLVDTVTTATTATNLTTNNDKTGYGLSAAAVQAIWDALTSAFLTVGSIGKKLADWVVGTIDTYTGNTKQTGDNYARLGAPAGASVSADVAAVKTDTGNLVTRITSTLFSGITSLAQWLGLIAGKQTGNSTARTELRATGAGSGTFDETTDSTEALRDRGDAAWITATGFSTLDAAGIRTAVGLAAANLDTQLTLLATASALASVKTDTGTTLPATLATIASYVDTEVAAILAAVDTEIAAIKAKTDNLPAAPAAVGDIPSAATIATAVVGETMTELAAVPGASPTLKQAVALLYMALRNQVKSGASLRLYSDAGVLLGTKTQSDDGTDYVEAKMS